MVCHWSRMRPVVSISGKSSVGFPEWFSSEKLWIMAFLGTTAFAGSALAQDEGMRLIERAEGRAWLYPAQVEALSRQSHRDGHCGGFFDVTYRLPVRRRRHLVEDFARRDPAQMQIVDPLLAQLSSRNLYKTVEALSALHDRHYQSDGGVAAAALIHARFASYASGRSDVSVSYFDHDFRQPSVIARIEGRGEAAKRKVVLGAHMDSINWSSSLSEVGRAPGADDDASGIATLLEVFRVLTASGYRPAKTLEFIAYAGEELGLLGSQDISDAYAEAQQQVVAVLQMDMVMYPSPERQLAFVVDNTNRQLTSFAQRLVRHYLKVDSVQTSCGYACSDHASWDRNGFATVFPFEASFETMNPRIHTEDDVLDHHLDAEHALLFAKLNTAFAVELTANSK
ncbi:MAG: M20/M25/M40 family metallo-hydrolase [Deltaproteobacteria bacterium]|nr:MAG: M20/M25/M40 family metallo-hydrolase [Deltaproteobacteria bacterium]